MEHFSFWENVLTFTPYVLCIFLGQRAHRQKIENELDHITLKYILDAKQEKIDYLEEKLDSTLNILTALIPKERWTKKDTKKKK